MRQGFLKAFHFFLILFFVSFQGQQISEVAGNWTGYIDIDGQELQINVTFSYSDEILDGTIDIPERGLYILPVEVMDATEDELVFQYQTGKGPAVFYGRRDTDNDEITGEFNQSGETHPFFLFRRTNIDASLTDVPETNLLISTGENEISGSLILSEEESPLVILVSGSGSKDRDQNIAGFNVFQHLALRLHNQGYSTFRYDDPGIGRSTGNPDVTLQEMAGDLTKIIEYIKSQYAENVSDLILFGHNQGGLVASMASKEEPVDGLILAATPFLTGDKIISNQIRKISEARDISDEIVQQNLEFQEKVYEAVRADTGWQAIENELSERLQNQIQELPVEHQNALGDMSAFVESQVDRQLETAKSQWFKSWVETEPVQLMNDLDVPLLAIFGEKDSQILPETNKVKADSLASNADISLQTVVIPEANHLFQKADSGMPNEYGILEHEFAPGFINEISMWLDALE